MRDKQSSLNELIEDFKEGFLKFSDAQDLIELLIMEHEAYESLLYKFCDKILEN